jgi:spermidine/putrescine transport system substrate-binding protein
MKVWPGVATYPLGAGCSQRPRWLEVLLALLAAGLLVACSGLGAGESGTPTARPLAEEIVLHDWAGDLADEILNGFTAESGIKVKYVVYGSPEEAVANIRAGETLDVVVLENEYIPSLVKDGLLARIDYRNVPNFNHISANFRDLAYDPENKHSVPYSWGTTGLVVRSDLVDRDVLTRGIRWADMWDPQYAGRNVQWEIPRYTLGMALKSLGY